VALKTYDNFGKLIGEINIVVIPTQGVITTNTTYDGDRVLSRTLSFFFLFFILITPSSSQATGNL
jgi:hypothetical protein